MKDAEWWPPAELIAKDIGVTGVRGGWGYPQGVKKPSTRQDLHFADGFCVFHPSEKPSGKGQGGVRG